ncbi:NT-3 growth factor receptor-like [Cimex lectularius]|uniref:Protein kinase domain-containing protein n=1 Tax=Cimex lectularius TaxID=79782 RepID=A0A8I6RVZ4_CIMLE|nr:NT-3 growth factor receptor-like [Cimex lectularius]
MGPVKDKIIKLRNQRNSEERQAGGWTLRGDCTAEICGMEAACKPLRKNFHTCICPHDSSIPTKDLKCPNRLIVPPTPNPIRNIIPPTTIFFNDTSGNSSWTPNPPLQIQSGLTDIPNTFIAASVTGIVVCVLLCIALPLYNKCKKRACIETCGKKSRRENHENVITPVSLSKGLLDPDCYATNPQYMAASPENSMTYFSPLVLPRDSIIFQNVIGEGCFGKVYKGELTLQNKNVNTVAIKVLKDSATKEAEDDFMREVEIMTSFHHSNILSLLGVVAKEPGKSPMMVFEFMPYGDLTEVLRSNSTTFWKHDSNLPRLNKESLLNIAMQIACGMCYLAEQHFVHRDLACRNCLVGLNLTVKIADFGMSRDVYTCDYYKIGGSRLLPVRWMSPESITYGRFTLESDVWSFGVVLWEIYSLGKQPYFGNSNEDVVKLILQGIMLIPPKDCPLGICDIMRLCWKTEPRDRINFEKICSLLKRIKATCAEQEPLPRPPPFPVSPLLHTAIKGLHVTEIEVEDYLEPQPSATPHEYIQPLPD